MFCQECGTKNSDDSLYCEECGAKLDNPIIEASEIKKEQQYVQPEHDYVQTTKPAAVKPVKKSTKIIIGVIVIICLTIVCLYNYAKKQCSPQKAAEQYFLNVMNGKWDKVYSDFEIKETEFITKGNFIEKQKKHGKTDYDIYKIRDVKPDKASLKTKVDILYRLKGDTESSDYSVILIKQSKKRFLFFDSWKVDPSSFIQKDYVIEVPKGTVVTLDGIKLKSKDVKENNDGYTDYMIPKLFIGKYSLKITKENMNDVNATILSEDGGYSLDQMTLKKDVSVKLMSDAQEALAAIYKEGIAGSDFDKISDYFADDQEIRDQALSDFDNFKSSIKNSDGVGLQKVDFSNFTGDTSYETDNGVLTVSVSLSSDYAADYTQADWWTGDITSSNYSGSNQNDFVYIFKNGKWALKSFDFDVIYY